MLNVQLHKKMWAVLEGGQLKSALADACIFDKQLQPDIMQNDPLSSNGSISNDAINRLPTHMFTARWTYLYHLRKSVYMEPEFGYVIAEPNALIDLSLAGSEYTRYRKTLLFFSGIPSYNKFIAAKNGRLPVKKEPIVASLHFIFDANYYHMYRDVMSKLKIFDDYGIDKRVPLVISSDLAKQPFFQQMRARGELAKRNWLVQDNFYIHADEVIFARPDVYDRAQIDYFLECADAPEADKECKKRIFLTRSTQSGRYITNEQEIIPILTRFGFEMVDTAMMKIEEQMQLFSQTECLIAIHGAGLTNMIFRRNGVMKILELVPPSERSLCFFELARMYGFEYKSIRGSNSLAAGRYSAFYLDPKLLTESLVNYM